MSVDFCMIIMCNGKEPVYPASQTVTKTVPVITYGM